MKEISDENLFDYLNGSLDPKARQAFEARLQSDPELAARVALEREIDAALSDSAENALRANLDRIGQKVQPSTLFSGFRSKWLGLFGIVLLVSCAGYLYWDHQGKQAKTSPATTPEKPLPASPQAGQPIAQTEPAQETSPQKNAPLAAAYRPIPRLEQYIHSQVRSGDFKVTVSQPQHDAVFTLQNKKMTFLLKGNTVGERPEDSKFRLLIFDNNVQKFEAMQTIHQMGLPLSSNRPFEWQIQLAVAPGLYYFLIEEENSGEWYHVGRIQLR